MYVHQVKTYISLLLLTSISQSVSYRILVVFPTGSYSHQIPQQAISKGLAAAGHHVTIISPNTFETTNPNITQIDVSFTYEYAKVFDLSGGIGPWQVHSLETIWVTKIIEGLLDYEPVAKLYRNENGTEHFDAVIVASQPFLPLFMAQKVFDATVIGFGTLEMFPMLQSAMGHVIHPILHPFYIYSTPTSMNIFDRIMMIYFDIYHRYWQEFEFLPQCDRLIRKYFPDSGTTSKELLHSMDFAIEGISPVLGNIRPMVPNTIQIGFLHIKDPKPLPSDLQKYLDQSENGVIYLSFGSNVKSAELKPEIRQIIIETLKDLPYDVLWKFENDSLPHKPENVRIEKWLPQQDVLAHKNIKLFITQGGMQSMEETIDRGVPVVAIPFFNDQTANAKKIEGFGIGKRLDLEDLTVDSLKSKIFEVINNPK